MLAQIQRFQRRHQAVFFLGLTASLPGNSSEALGFGLDAIRAIEPDDGLLRQIRGERPQRLGKLRPQKSHSWKWNPCTYRLNESVFCPPLDVQLTGALV